MQYELRFGTLKTEQGPPKPTDRFRIAVLGDFSGSGNKRRMEIGDTLADRKAMRVHFDNFDDVLAKLDLRLMLPAGSGGAVIEVPIRSLDDFHPDQLYTNVPLFEKLVGLRQKLQDPTSFAKAASAVHAMAITPDPEAVKALHSASSRVPRKRIESFADLLYASEPAAQTSELKTLMRSVVGPHVQPQMQGQAELTAAVDTALSELMRSLLHHPDFQAAESLWRSLDMLMRRLDGDAEIDLVLLDINAAEFAADLAAGDSLNTSGLFRALVERPAADTAQGAYALIICAYEFEKIPPHAELLARAGKIAAAAGAPMVTAIDIRSLEKTGSDQENPLVKQAWSMLQSQPESVYLMLTAPRFMLRWPYGKKTEPIESFKFEEFTPKSGLGGMLWGQSSFLAAVCLAQTFATDGMKGMKLGSVLTVDDIPFYYYNDSYGDQVALPCTERLINLSAAQALTAQGIVPALSLQGQNEVRLGGLISAAGKPPAGPWAPVAIPSDGSSAPVMIKTTAPDPIAAATAAPTAAPAPASAAEQSNVDAELDALLAGLDSPAPADAPAPAEAQAAPEDELDNLLASLDSADAKKADESSEVDAELAALLDSL